MKCAFAQSFSQLKTSREGGGARFNPTLPKVILPKSLGNALVLGIS
jgi:hypothetical protein